jgi:hypothetical protein
LSYENSIIRFIVKGNIITQYFYKFSLSCLNKAVYVKVIAIYLEKVPFTKLVLSLIVSTSHQGRRT